MRLMENPFCPGALMGAIIRSMPDPVSFADTFAPICRLEARASLALQESGYLNGEIHRTRALGSALVDQLLASDDDTRLILFWAEEVVLSWRTNRAS